MFKVKISYLSLSWICPNNILYMNKFFNRKVVYWLIVSYIQEFKGETIVEYPYDDSW